MATTDLSSRSSVAADTGSNALQSLSSEEPDDDWGDRLPRTHSRPRILRRETSQILSYYQSEDANRSEPEYRYSTPKSDSIAEPHARGHRKADIRHNRGTSGLESRGISPSSSYSDISMLDHGPQPEGRLGRWERRGGQNVTRNGDRGRQRSRDMEDGAGGETSTDISVQYGIAIGSPSGNASPAMTSANRPLDTESATEMVRNGTKATADGNTCTRTDIGTGYGSNAIIDQFRPSQQRPAVPSHPNLKFDASHLPQPSVQSESQAQEQSIGTNDLSLQVEPVPAAVLTVDSLSDSNHVPDEFPSRRRKMSSQGASDKRRVAVVQVDSGTEGEHEGTVGGGRGGGMLSDGFGRVQSQPAPDRQEQQQARAQFSVKPLPYSNHSPSSFSLHPPSAFASNAGSKPTTASALLARRGIVGTFAFVAPPDASPSAYTNLGYFTPPLSAPPSARPTPPLLLRHESSESSTSATSNTAGSSRRQHQRSQSEAVLTGAQVTVNRTSPKSEQDATSSESASKGRERRYGHRLRKSSRDIGIVGTSTAASPTSEAMKTEVHLSDETERRTASSSGHKPAQTAQLSPIFQTPSRSQTSLISSDGAPEPASNEARAQAPPTASESKRYSQQHTTNADRQGNGTRSSTASRSRREEHQSNTSDRSDSSYMWHASNVPSASVYSTYYTPNGTPSPAYSYYTMATTASSSSSSSPPVVLTMPVSTPSPYLYYQPGLHATAGPLPSPPRQIIPPKRESPPPPRPPRLHAPSSGSSSLAKRRSDTSVTSKQEHASVPSPVVKEPEVTSPTMTPSTTSSTLVNSQSEDSVKSKGHTREGAFPMDSVIVKEDATHARLSVKQDQQEQQSLKRKSTMDDLVRDVTAAIDDATGLAQNTGATPTPAETSSPAKKNEPSPPPKPKQLNLQERRSGMDLRREESRSTFKGGEPSSPTSPSSTYSGDEGDNVADITVTKPLPDPLTASPHSTHRTESQESVHVSKPQKMLDIALKRFSALPRPPSRLSASRASPRSSVSHERASHDRSDTGHSAGHGSHLGHEQQRSGPSRTRAQFVVKIRSTCPDAMQFGDVLAKRTSVERSLGYARKINELANHDPGLGDWVSTTKYNLTVPGKGSKRKSASSGAVRSPSEHSFTFQPRQSSRGSIASEMTFPRRMDAYVATDLLPQRSEEDPLPRGPPPTLPYPTLAQAPPSHQQQSTRLGVSSSTRSNASSLGSSKSTGGGFFASIGRKTSVKKDRPTISAPQPNKLLSKRQQPAPTPAPRPVQINAAPSLPGGPRAPPGRMQRAQSVIAPKSTHSESETDSARRKSIKRSPSVVPSLAQNGPNQFPESSPDMDAKLNKLADLLPHADRKILAGYLRRAGGIDMVAIGRFLDDDKNGVLIRE